MVGFVADSGVVTRVVRGKFAMIDYGSHAFLGDVGGIHPSRTFVSCDSIGSGKFRFRNVEPICVLCGCINRQYISGNLSILKSTGTDVFTGSKVQSVRFV